MLRFHAAKYLLLCVLSIGCSFGEVLWSWHNETHMKDIHAVLTDGFEISSSHQGIGIGADDSLTLAQDPLHPGSYVLRVFYKKGTYTHYNSAGHVCGDNEKCQGGAHFHSSPKSIAHGTHLTLTLEYEVLFDNSFVWNKGGKLPGLWGGTTGCSGGNIRDDCFSTRLMWHGEGQGIVYAYVTHNQHPSFTTWCHKYDAQTTENYRRIHCTQDTGINIGLGSFRFQHHKWHKIRQEVHLNQKAGQPGYIILWVDGVAKVHVTDIIMRDNTGFDIDGLLFATFYGGGDNTWACPHDTYTFYRNFKISNDTHSPSHSELIG